MTAPAPSAVRTVRIYPGGAGPNMGLLGPNAILTWPSKHPLVTDWWWVNASGWLVDPSGTAWDTLGQIAKQVIGDDAGLTVARTAYSADRLQAGFLLEGGTPGLTYLIRPVLTGATTARQWSEDIRLTIGALAPVSANPPGVATSFGSVITVGGIQLPIAS